MLWTYVVPFLVSLSIVIFVHELGHFLVARWNGVHVEVFSIGFGPEIIGRTDARGTRWKISALPLGGYVKFLGDADAASMAVAEDGSAVSPFAFAAKSVGQRAAVIFAGPAANFIFAILVFAAVFTMVGRPFTPPIVGSVEPGAAAARAGIQPGDRIIAVEGHAVDQFEDLRLFVPIYGVGKMDVTVVRDGRHMTLETYPDLREISGNEGKSQKVPVLGVRSPAVAVKVERLGLAEAFREACSKTWEISVGTLTALRQMVFGERGTEDLGGPIRIAEYSADAAQAGSLGLIIFMAMLSVNLGLVNLLPLPVLDGGHLVLCAWEAIFKKPVMEKVQDVGLKVGLLFLLGLMIFTTWNDISRLIVS